MSEPTKEEMIHRFDVLVNGSTRFRSPALQEELDSIDAAIRRLIQDYLKDHINPDNNPGKLSGNEMKKLFIKEMK